MNFSDNLFSLGEDGLVHFPESLGMSVASIGDNGLFEFNYSSADRLFNDKKLEYFMDIGVELFCLKRPQGRIFSVTGLSRAKSNGSSKSSHEPSEKKIVGIANFKASVVNRVGLVFRLIFFNPKTTFGINKTSKICEVVLRNFFGWTNCSPFFDCLGVFYFVLLMSYVANAFDQIKSMVYSISCENLKAVLCYMITKLNIDLAFGLFCNKERQNLSSKINTCLPAQLPFVAIAPISGCICFSYRSSKFFLKPVKSFFFGARDLYRVFVNGIFGGHVCSNIKTSISIDETSSISSVKACNHKYSSCVGKLYIDSIGKLKKNARPAETKRSRHGRSRVCDSPTRFERFGGGINKTSRHQVWSVA